MAYDTIVSGGSVVIPGQGIQEVDLAIQGEQIAAILPRGASVEAGKTIDATGLHVLPGGLDTHTHWGFQGGYEVECESDSKAAAIGGTTTALVFQFMEPGKFQETKEVAERLSTIDFVTTPIIRNEETAAYLEEAIEEWGCSRFKFFLGYRTTGVDLTDGLFSDLLRRMAKYEGTVACVHAENQEIINRTMAKALDQRSEDDGLAAWASANPGQAEAESILRASFFAEQAGLPVYIVHMAGRDAVNALRRAQSHWPQTYGETCSHYLFHNVETSSKIVKFSPPVRYQADNEALWEALATGAMHCVGSDNASTSWDAKQGNVWDIPRGGPGAGVCLPLVLSEGVNKGRLTLERAAEVTSTNAARIFGLYPKKGTIQEGSDADLAIVDMNLEKTFTRDTFPTWSDYSLYDGATFKGWPVMTLLRGQVVAENGEVKVDPSYGQFIPRWAKRR